LLECFFDCAIFKAELCRLSEATPMSLESLFSNE